MKMIVGIQNSAYRLPLHMWRGLHTHALDIFLSAVVAQNTHADFQYNILAHDMLHIYVFLSQQHSPHMKHR